MSRRCCLALAFGLLTALLSAPAAELPQQVQQFREEAYGLPDSLSEPQRWRDALEQRGAFLKKLQEAIRAEPSLANPLARTLLETERSIACDGIEMSSMNRRHTSNVLSADVHVLAWLEGDHPYVALASSSNEAKQLRLSLRRYDQTKRQLSDWLAIAAVDVDVAPKEILIAHFDGIPTSGVGQVDSERSFALCASFLEDGNESRPISLRVQGVEGWVGEASRYVAEPGEITITIPPAGAFHHDEKFTIYVPKRAASRVGNVVIPRSPVDREGLIETENGFFLRNRSLTLRLQLPAIDTWDLITVPDCYARIAGGSIIMDEQDAGPLLLVVGKDARVRRLTVPLPQANRLDAQPLSDEPTARMNQLIPRFRTSLWSIRAHAEQQIAACGKPVIPKMIELLSALEKNEQTNADREAAADVLVLLADQAVDDVAALLTHENWEVRRDAAHVLQRIGGRGTDLLLGAATAGKVNLRRAALGALESSKDPRRREVFLQALAADEADLRREALSGLFRVGDQESRQAIARSLTDPDPEVRRSALGCLSQLRATEYVAQVTVAASDRDAEVRETAVSTLGTFGLPESVPVVLAALGDPKPNVRRGAAWALTRLSEAKLVNEGHLGLLVTLLCDAEHEARWTATWNLARLKTELAMDYLLYALNDPDQDIRLEANRGIVALGYRTRSRPNPPAPESKRPRIHYGGPETDLLYTLEPNEVPPLPSDLAGLIEALSSKDWFTRQAACDALAARGEEAIPLLTKALDDGPRLLQLWAIKTLGKIDRPAARAALARFAQMAFAPQLAPEHRLLAIAAIDALSTMPDETLLPMWLRLLTNEDFYVRLRAAEAIGRTGGADSLDALLAQLNDPRTEVRQRVIWTLGKLRDPTALDPIMERFNNARGEEPNRRPVYEDYDQYRSDLEALEEALVSYGELALDRLMAQVSAGGGQSGERAAALLSRIGPAAVPHLIAALTGDGAGAAAMALARLKSPEAIRPLIAACGGDQRHQNLAFEALSQYGEVARADLLEALNDQNLNGLSRSTAAILLVSLADKSGWAQLEDDVMFGDRQVLNLVANRMGSTKCRDFLPLLELALARPEAGQTVVYSVAYCGGKDALPILEAALNHPNEGVRTGAKSWIERLSKEPAR